MTDHADARPTKRFFTEMLTADISLEDAVLDLIDNAVDSWCVTRDIKLDEGLLLSKAAAHRSKTLGSIRVDLSSDSIQVTDTCGGIEESRARNEVFRLGRPEGADAAWIGVYGIGLKRALFKMGRAFVVESRTVNSGFRASLEDLEKWEEDDQDWTIPLESLSPARSVETAGTRILITKLRPEVRRRARDGTLGQSLVEAISRAYCLFLDVYVRVKVEKSQVVPIPVPIGASNRATAAMQRVKVDNGRVRAVLVASLAERDEESWQAAEAGWYVFCNGRLVLFADKTDATGWGSGILPQFVSKFRGFVGAALFFATDPSRLPWTTTKRALNRDSEAFQEVRPKLGVMAKPVLAFLNRMYQNEALEEPEERAIASGIKRIDLKQLARGHESAFEVQRKRRKTNEAVSVQFSASQSELERVRLALRDPKASATKIGRHAFEYFLRTECP